eukprot:400584_1
MDLIERIDKAIGRYYALKGAIDYFNDQDDKGIFYHFCHENAFDDYNVKQEIDEGYEECCLVGFDKNVPDATTDKAIYKLIKRCYKSCMNEPEQKYEDNDSSDDELMEECLIDPNNDRRQAIHSSPHKDFGIIQCIGSLRIIYRDVTGPPEKSLGSGTVIQIDHENRCYILTAAHNARGTLRECKVCQNKTLKMKCCNKTTKKLNPTQLIEADSIQFERRCVKRETKINNETYKFGQVKHSYEIIECKVREKLYHKYASPDSGYDICIMVFQCNDKEGINIYNTYCPNIELVCDPLLGNSPKNKNNAQICIYGYPGSKFNQDKQYEMWGMSTSAMKGHKLKTTVFEQTGKTIITNQDIDTTPGQSGACLWSWLTKSSTQFLIYAVHSGGYRGSKKKQRSPRNVVTLLDNENLKWIQKYVPQLKTKIVQSVYVTKSVYVTSNIQDFLAGKGLAKNKDALIDLGLQHTDLVNELDDDDINDMMQEANMKKLHQKILRKAIKDFKSGKYKPVLTDDRFSELREKRKHLKGYVPKLPDPFTGKKDRTIIFIGQTGVGKTTFNFPLLKSFIAFRNIF